MKRRDEAIGPALFGLAMLGGIIWVSLKIGGAIREALEEKGSQTPT